MKDKIIVLKIIQENEGLEYNFNINWKNLSKKTVNKINYLITNFVYELNDLLEVDNYDKIWD